MMRGQAGAQTLWTIVPKEVKNSKIFLLSLAWSQPSESFACLGPRGPRPWGPHEGGAWEDGRSTGVGHWLMCPYKAGPAFEQCHSV